MDFFFYYWKKVGKSRFTSIIMIGCSSVRAEELLQKRALAKITVNDGNTKKCTVKHKPPLHFTRTSFWCKFLQKKLLHILPQMYL